MMTEGQNSVNTVPDKEMSKLRPGPTLLTSALLLALVLAPPIVLTFQSGSTPYDMLKVSFPGLDVAVLTALGQGVGDLASMLTFGALVFLLFFRDARGKGAAKFGAPFELTVLRIASGVWASVSAAMVLFEMLDSNGFPFLRLDEPGALAFLFESSFFPRAWLVSMLAATVTYFASMFATRWTGLLIPLWASCFGILAPVAVGQILVGPDHDFGSDAGYYQSLLTSAVFGTILVIAIRHATGRMLAPEILSRFFRFAAVGIPVIVASDVLLAWFKLAGTGLFDSVTGRQIVARWICLLVLIVALIGWQRAQKRGTRRHAATWFLTIMTVAISGWVGVTAAMTRFPPPQYFVPTSISQVFMGFEVSDPPSMLVWFTHWRPNILFIMLAVAAVIVYLWAVRVLSERGDRWPVGRVISWIAGWVVVVFATSSGLGKYSAPDFGTHMIVHMSLNMLAPILLVMGGVITLLLRATRSDSNHPAGIHDWLTWVLHWKVLRLIYNPLIIFALFVSSYYGLYFSGIFEEAMRFHWAHQFMNVHFLIIGYLFYSLVIGVDRPPRPLPHIGKLGFVLAAMPFHAFFGVILMTAGGDIVAENFYLYLGLPWTNLEASQYLGGGVAWAGGELPLLLVIIVLGVQWSRQDAKEARRKDRHMDSGRDEEFEDYNRMLDKLASRKAGSRAAQPQEQTRSGEESQQ